MFVVAFFFPFPLVYYGCYYSCIIHVLFSLEVATQVSECYRSLKSNFNKGANGFGYVTNIPITDPLKSSGIGVVSVCSNYPLAHLDNVILKSLSHRLSIHWLKTESPVHHFFGEKIAALAEHEPDLRIATRVINDVSKKISSSEIISNTDSASSSNNSAIIEVAKANMLDFAFNSLEFTDKNEIVTIALYFINNCGLVDIGALNVYASDLIGYVKLIAGSYKEHPFHNLQHGLSVLQSTILLLTQAEAKSFLSPLQLFSTLMSAYIHDVGHPGNTNMFEINTRSELSILYNDTSCLENYHLYLAFQLTRTEKSNILRNFNRNQINEYRKFMVGMVLSTDMSVHSQLVNELKSRSDETQKKLSDDVNEQLFFCKIIVHSADLSNPARPFDQSKKWSSLISEEFNRQVEVEKSLGLPFLPFMITPDLKTLCKNEIGFASFAVAPLWKGLGNWFPKLMCHYEQVMSNVVKWKEIMASES